MPEVGTALYNNEQSRYAYLLQLCIGYFLCKPAWEHSPILMLVCENSIRVEFISSNAFEISI